MTKGTNRGGESIHDDPDPSASSLAHTDGVLKERMDKQDEVVNDIQKFIAQELASSRRAFITSVANLIVLATALVGGGIGFEYHRRSLNDIRDSSQLMQVDIRDLKDTSSRSQIDIALIQRDLRPIDSLKAQNEALEERIRELELIIARRLPPPGGN